MITVIIPCYNGEKYIKKTIETVLAQTYQDFEVIIVDDGSTDSSKQVIEQFNDKRIKYVYQENAGVSAARNKGIELAQGEYIAFLDADDWWMPEKLQLQLNIAETHKDYGFIFCNMLQIEEINSSQFVKTFQTFKNQYSLVKNLLLVPFNNPCPSTVFIKKDLLLKAGYYDTTINHGEDLDMSLRLAMHTKFYCINKTLVAGIRAKEGLSRGTSMEYKFENHKRFLNKFFNEVDKEQIYAKYKNIAYAFIYFNIGFHYFFANSLKHDAAKKSTNWFILIKKLLRKAINFYISLL